MATMKSLGCKTFYSSCSLHVFISHEATDRQWVYRACVHISAWYVRQMVCLTDSNSMWRGIIILSCKTDTNCCAMWASREQVSIEEPFVLCVHVLCSYSNCMITTRLLHTFILSLARGIRISTANWKHCLAKWERQGQCFPLGHLSLIWLSVVFDLLPLLLLCLWLLLPWFQLPVRLSWGRMFGCHGALHSD